MLYMAHPALSAIPTPPSATPPPVQNPQTLQQFPSPLYVSMDLITNLPLSNQFYSILTIVDQGCSKAAKFLPCSKTIDGKGIARLYLQHLFPWFGVLKRIISDCD